MIKVSVIVPTYCPGDGLARLVESLDRQSLPVEEFEVLFVDDGSPDDTFSKLEQLARLRPHFQATRIENSGWPSRPRNVGTDLAIGEYVAYLDHDDELYPDALRGAYEFAVANDADVVNGKEARTHDAEWAIDTYRADVPNSKGREDQHPLLPMNPHKLYRRAFLVEHGIRFREGGKVLWEDIFFNVRVAKHARVISTLASVPYYHWFTTTGSGSTGFRRDNQEWWTWLDEVFSAISLDLADAPHSLERSQLLAHQYRWRVLSSFDSSFPDRPTDVKDMIYAACRDLQGRFLPPELDSALNRSAQIRAHLLRSDRRDLIDSVIEHDPVIAGRGRTTQVQWVDGVLQIEAEAVWSSSAGQRHPLRRTDGRIVKDLPESIEAAIPVDLGDVTTEVADARAELGTRSRSSRVTWMLPSESRVQVTDAADGAGVGFTAPVRARLDPRTAAFGGRLEDPVWDVNVRCTLAGVATQARVTTDITPIATTDGTDLWLAYANADGFLSIDLSQSVKNITAVLKPATERASVKRVDGQVKVSVPLADIDATGSGRIETSVALEVADRQPLLKQMFKPAPTSKTRVKAQIRVADGTSWLEFSLPGGVRKATAFIGQDRSDPAAPWTVSA